MTAQEQLHRLMATPLATRSLQRRKPYRPSQRQTTRIFNILNQAVVQGHLCRPTIALRRQVKSLGWCIGQYQPNSYGSYSRLELSDKYYNVQWFIMVLAHEMSHQYQWDIIGRQRLRQGRLRLMSHGPSFFKFRQRLQKFGIPLRRRARIDHWFEYQDFRKL